MRHKALQCLEELQRHFEIDLSKHLVSQTSNTDESKYKSLTDLLKHSNDWLSPQYSSIIRVVSKNIKFTSVNPA